MGEESIGRAHRRDSDVIELSRNPVKLLIWTVILLCGIWLALQISNTVLIFSLAVLMAYLFAPEVKWIASRKIPFSKRNVPWAIATILVYLIFVALLTILLITFVPLVVTQANSLAASMPAYLNKLEEHFGRIQDWFYALDISPTMQENIKKYAQAFVERITPTFSIIAGSIASGIFKMFSALIIILAGFLFSMYIVLDVKNIKSHFYDMFPSAWRKDTEELFHNISKVVGSYIRGQVLLCLIIAAVSYLGLSLLNMFGVEYQYNLLTSITIGILYPIPFIGVWLPRILAPILAYAQPVGGLGTAVWVFLVISSTGLAIDNFALPVILGKGIGISPLMILVVVFAGGELFGIWGLILSIPAAAVIRLIFFYIQRHFTI